MEYGFFRALDCSHRRDPERRFAQFGSCRAQFDETVKIAVERDPSGVLVSSAGT
jgi:hypothetical protein